MIDTLKNILKHKREETQIYDRQFRITIMKITKAVIPVAGLGTRMLPATKSIPKEMLPIVDKPLIQYVVNEAVAAGIKDIILVTHSSKNAIENHFDRSFELESTLEKRVKRQMLDEVKSICPPGVTIMHVRQGEAKGLGHAINCAKSLIAGKPFAVILPDVLIDQYKSNLSQDNLREMIYRFEKTGHSQIMVEPVNMDDVSSYGVIATDKNKEEMNLTQGSSIKITDFVEKPAKENAPSNLAIVGRYVLSGDIWNLFEQTPIGAGGEIQLTDTLKLMLKQNAEMDAYVLKGRSLDCGSKLGYLKAIVEYAVRDKKLGGEFLNYIKDVASQYQ